MPVVEIISKTCLDCYRCLRQCPVHAITVQQGHARVSVDRCLYCGQCVRECPRHAIRVRSSLGEVKRMIASGAPVIASVSLMESSRISPVVAEIMPDLLKLGFAGAEATTRALRPVWTRYRRIAQDSDRFVIASGCPAVVTLIERHFPEAIGLLAPVVSHAEAHARMIKARARARGIENVKVVHISSEPAIKGELRRAKGPMALDAALTLKEVRKWLRSKGVAAAHAEPSAPLTTDETGPPLEWVRDILPIYGMHECVDFLKRMHLHIPKGTVVEMATCRYGCGIGSPRLLARVPMASACLYPEGSPLAPDRTETWDDLDLSRTFHAQPIERKLPDEKELEDIYERMGIWNKDQMLNCGACGYDTCREMAVAVFQGAAEPEMCMPHMRRQASRISLILQYTANGLLLVNHSGRIEYANPSFRRMFRCEDEPVKGKLASEVLGSDLFEKSTAVGGTLAVRDQRPDFELVYRAQVFPIQGEPLLAAVIVDISREARASREFTKVREATLERAQEVISRQMTTAQEIAGLLGETTAETKALLVKLMNLARQESIE